MKVYDGKEYKLNGDNSNLKPICEIEISEPLDIIRLNGELWEVCIVGIKEDYIVIKRLGITDLKEDEEAEELFAEDEVTCPYCGRREESFELDDFEDEHICLYCGSVFSYQREISVTYNMQPIRVNKDIIELKEQKGKQ